MTSTRMSIFESQKPSDSELDVSAFRPKAPAPAAPAAEQLDQLSQGSKFRSREAVAEAPVPATPAASRRAPRTHRTGRNQTISVKTTAAAADLFYQLADQSGLKVAETFERALAALQRELEREGR
ncbi:hypothetical protein [Teichococcus aestuarii]|uniref:hypothetical protein n=1 Tax=Teichococcus aestuarii TaxID=568898 RepID=UPI0036084B54